MNIYPAIDLYEGKVVRLKRGDYNEKTVYSDNPPEMASKWESQGAKWLHLVDLEGAKSGKILNLVSVQQIRKMVNCKLEFGGGIRKIEDIQMMVDAGVDRVILGTKSLDSNFFDQAMSKFGEKIAVGLDVREGIVQTQGWLNAEKQTLIGAVVHFNNYPLQTIIYTDINKDGMLKGPNFDTIHDILKISKASIILSGGVGTLNDITHCKSISANNFDGVIIGKALYDDIFTLKDVFEELDRK